jgi:hypothetical protein
MLNTSPGKTDEETCHSANENGSADPVGLPQLLHESQFCHAIQAHE